jgi:hypothetical protein
MEIYRNLTTGKRLDGLAALSYAKKAPDKDGAGLGRSNCAGG